MRFFKEACMDGLAKMILLDELPFRFVEGEVCKQFCMKLQFKFDHTSRSIVTRDIFQLFLKKEKKIIR